jgi:hypothetical protein
MATPIVVGDLVYYANETGQSRVIKVLGDKMEIVGEGELEVGIQASAVVADGALFFRTKTMLYKLAP